MRDRACIYVLKNGRVRFVTSVVRELSEAVCVAANLRDIYGLPTFIAGWGSFDDHWHCPAWRH